MLEELLDPEGFLNEAMSVYKDDIYSLGRYVSNWFRVNRDEEDEEFDRMKPFGQDKIGFSETMQILQDNLSVEDYILIRMIIGMETGL